MGARGPAEHPMKAYLLAQIAAGELKPREAAQIAAVTRQRVEQWCIEAKIDARQCRHDYLKALWERELRKAKMAMRGVKPKKRTKVQQRELGERAVRRGIGSRIS